MAKRVSYIEELKKFRNYLLDDSNEDAKRKDFYPLFEKLFGEKFKTESNAKGADGYVDGKIIIECKTNYSDWLAGFYQAMHYQKKFGLAYSMIIVLAHKFIGIWKINKIPENVFLIAYNSNPQKAPNQVGRENARETKTADKNELIEEAEYFLPPKKFDRIFYKLELAKSNLMDGSPLYGIEYILYDVLGKIKNVDIERQQIDADNFINQIEQFKAFFDSPIEAIHAFYSIIAYWDITSKISTNENGENVELFGFGGRKHSDVILIKKSLLKEFKKFVEDKYVFTNEGSGRTVDYYFSRFDEVISKLDPEYVRQHGIFFTNIELSKFALWFAQDKIPVELNEKYIWFDPAGGSGNLISSWHGDLKHKIISELQPDLLKIIERRMKIDLWHIQKGFTIIPKTSENKGLNFLDCDANSYIKELEKELNLKNLSLDKPFAFLLNPPYKNTDENERSREKSNANYKIHDTILQYTGEDAGKERYLAFLSQILNMSKLQYEKNGFESLVLIFTPTSWLIPRPTYKNFRQIWDGYFKYIDGFIVTGREFFKIPGKWPVAFTIWSFKSNKLRKNTIQLFDFTNLTKSFLENINWGLGINELNFILSNVISEFNKIVFDISRGDIRTTLPYIQTRDKYISQPMLDFKRSPTKYELKNLKIIGGLPLYDGRRKNKKTYGIHNGKYVGLMDDLTPCRIKQDNYRRVSQLPDRCWFRLDNSFADCNKSTSVNCPTPVKSYCAYDLDSAKATFSWFSILKAICGKYPIWTNQFDLWPIKIRQELEFKWFALCFSYVLAENRCVVTKFEENNPVKGAPVIFVDNPLCPIKEESLWMNVLDFQVRAEHGIAYDLTNKIKSIYRFWNINYCKGQLIYDVGLKNEPYFKYFNYKDFLTRHSGLIQIRKFAEINNLADLIELFEEIQNITKQVKDEIYRLLVEEFKYFD
jgi:hypothetical protein